MTDDADKYSISKEKPTSDSDPQQLEEDQTHADEIIRGSEAQPTEVEPGDSLRSYGLAKPVKIVIRGKILHDTGDNQS